MMEISKTPLLKRLEALEQLTEQLLQVAIAQGEINFKLTAKVKTLLSEAEENDTAPHSGLILPDRLNS